MRVLTVYAHPNPKSFCHAILERFTEGLNDGGHTCEVLDLYEVRFDPVFRMQDFGSYVHESMPREILEAMNLRQRVLDFAGGPVRRAIASVSLSTVGDCGVSRDQERRARVLLPRRCGQRRHKPGVSDTRVPTGQGVLAPPPGDGQSAEIPEHKGWLANRSSASAFALRAPADNLRELAPSEGWCGSGDLNPDGLAATSS